MLKASFSIVKMSWIGLSWNQTEIDSFNIKKALTYILDFLRMLTNYYHKFGISQMLPSFSGIYSLTCPGLSYVASQEFFGPRANGILHLRGVSLDDLTLALEPKLPHEKNKLGLFCLNTIRTDLRCDNIHVHHDFGAWDFLIRRAYLEECYVLTHGGQREDGLQ